MQPHNLDELARLIRLYGLVLCYGRDGSARLAFRTPGLPADVKRAIRNHRRALATRMKQGDIRLCPILAHKQFYRYIGAGRFQCEKCVELDAWQAGLWAAA